MKCIVEINKSNRHDIELKFEEIFGFKHYTRNTDELARSVNARAVRTRNPWIELRK